MPSLWKPAPGSGKHAYLNHGNGLASSPGRFGAGWLPSDADQVAPTDENLACDSSSFATWTPSPGDHENLPINCVSWYEAQAFCIWDGGFLPSANEWEYAAAGGRQQLRFPWGSTDPGKTSQFAIAGCSFPDGSTDCEDTKNIAPVGHAGSGAGRWGQLDLSGELEEWALDRYASVPVPCWDCAATDANDTPDTENDRTISGVSYAGGPDESVPDADGFRGAAHRSEETGLRCGRPPSAEAAPSTDARSDVGAAGKPGAPPSTVPPPARANVSGWLKIDAKRFPVTSVVAKTELDVFPPTKDTVVLLTDRPVRPEQFAESSLNELAAHGKLHGIVMTFDQRGRCSALVLLGLASASGNHLCEFKPSRFDLAAIGGRLTVPASMALEHKYALEARFYVPIRDAVTIPVDEVTGTELPPGGREPGKCFFEYDRALRSKDIAAIQRLVSKDIADSLARPDAAKMIEAVNALRPKLTRVVRGYASGANATPWVEIAATKPDHDVGGVEKVAMTRVGDRWVPDSW